MKVSKEVHIETLKSRVQREASTFILVSFFWGVNYFLSLIEANLFFPFAFGGLSGLIAPLLVGSPADQGTVILVNLVFFFLFMAIYHLAAGGKKAAFIVGMVIYGIDGLIWLLFGDIGSAVMHLIVLAFMWDGLRSLKILHETYHIYELKSGLPSILPDKKNAQKGLRKWMYAGIFMAKSLVVVGISVGLFILVGKVGTIGKTNWYLTVHFTLPIIIVFAIFSCLLVGLYLGKQKVEQESRKR